MLKLTGKTLWIGLEAGSASAAELLQTLQAALLDADSLVPSPAAVPHRQKALCESLRTIIDTLAPALLGTEGVYTGAVEEENVLPLHPLAKDSYAA